MLRWDQLNVSIMEIWYVEIFSKKNGFSLRFWDSFGTSRWKSWQDLWIYDDDNSGNEVPVIIFNILSPAD